MNVLVVDTSSWISYFKKAGHSKIDEALSEGRVYLLPLVCAELLSGKMPPKQRKILTSFLNELPLCVADREHWIRVGELRHDLLRKGFSISTPDAHIAQCTLDLEAYLVSEDKIFSKIQKKVKLKLI